MKRLAFFLVLMLLVVGASAAQQKAAPPVTLSLDVTDAPARDVVKSIAEKADAKVMADSTIGGKVTLKVSKVTLDEALNALCAARKLSWKVVYLASGTVAEADNVSQLVRTLEAMKAGGLVVLDRPAAKATTLVKNASITPAYEAQFSKQGSGYTPIYLVYDPKLVLVTKSAKKDGKTSWKTGDPMSAEQYQDVSRESLESLMTMNPDEQDAAIQGTIASQMDILINNPQVMQMFLRSGMQIQMDYISNHPEFMTQIMQMQIENIRSMTPEQRQKMVDAQMNMMKSIPPEQMQEMIKLMTPKKN